MRKAELEIEVRALRQRVNELECSPQWKVIHELEERLEALEEIHPLTPEIKAVRSHGEINDA